MHVYASKQQIDGQEQQQEQAGRQDRSKEGREEEFTKEESKINFVVGRGLAGVLYEKS